MPRSERVFPVEGDLTVQSENGRDLEQGPSSPISVSPVPELGKAGTSPADLAAGSPRTSQEGSLVPRQPTGSQCSQFRLSPQDLSNPISGSNKPVVFDWQKAEANFVPFGGIQGIISELRVNVGTGLDSNNAQDLQLRERHFGSNARKGLPPVQYWELIWEGLHDFTLILLIVSAIVSIILDGITEGWKTGWYEGVAILFAVVVVLNVAAINDIQKDKQFRELDKQNAQRMVKVRRNGNTQELMVDFLLAGDIVLMGAGDMTPADGVLLEGSDVEMDESSLTGESDMSKKNTQFPFLISGTTMTAGECVMLVVGVGPNSLQGIMTDKLGEDSPPTQLQLKLELIATQISKLGFAIALICFFAMLFKHLALWNQGLGNVDSNGNKVWLTSDWGDIVFYLIQAITILVVAIPEGLPLAVTISLAFSVIKMQKDKILVRHLEACEVMGGATTICTDKTGTLTMNEMKVVQMWVNDSDITPDSCGIFLNTNAAGSQEGYDQFIGRVKNLPSTFTELLFENCALNSTADLVIDGEGKEKVSGSKTDGALINLSRAYGMDYKAIRLEAQLEQKYPFSSARKRSSVLVWKRVGGHDVLRLYVKGAAEIILRLSTHILEHSGKVKRLEGDFRIDSQGNVSGSGQKAEIAKNAINAMANQAFRTIALAYRDYDRSVRDWKKDVVQYMDSDNKGSGECPPVEAGLTFLAIAGIQDPVRPGVPEAVVKCQEAGIVVRMVTGDNIATAIAIAKQCHIYEDGTQHLAVEGPDFREQVAHSPLDYFQRNGPRIAVMARSAPNDKHLLVTNLMNHGQVVAVTGDGTNDGPALKKANVGFAMGIAGTDVAKQACDIVLMDDNFTSIVKAVEWGRNVYTAIRKFLQFQLTVNLVALLICMVGSIFISDTVLGAVQMLWVNLIMDSFAALALATDPPDAMLLKRKPYVKTDSLISPFMIRNMLGQFFYQSIILITLIFCGEDLFEIPVGRELSPTSSPTQHYTLIFHIFVMLQLFNEFSSRTLENELNLIKGIEKNVLFLIIMAGTFAVQYVFVQEFRSFGRVAPLTAPQHGMSVIFGLGGIAVTFLMRLIPEKHMHFPNLGGMKAEMTPQERQIWSAFTRRNSNPFVLSSYPTTNDLQRGNANNSKKNLLEAIEETIAQKKQTLS